MTFSDDYADGLPAELVAACPSHRITGVTAIRASHATELGFFAYKDVMKLKGTCVE